MILRLYRHKSTNQVGFVHHTYPNNKVDIEFITQDGVCQGAEYLLENSLEPVYDLNWHDALLKHCSKDVYILIETEFVSTNFVSFGVWLRTGNGNKHRLLGTEDIHDPNKLLNYWDEVSDRMKKFVIPDVATQLLCIDYQNQDKQLTNYFQFWAKNILTK